MFRLRRSIWGGSLLAGNGSLELPPSSGSLDTRVRLALLKVESRDWLISLTYRYRLIAPGCFV